MRTTRPLLVVALIPAFVAAAPADEGLRGEYFADRSFTALGTARLDGPIDFTFDRVAPYKGDKLPAIREGHYEHFAIRWTGRVVPRFSETYTFYVTVDDGALLWIDGALVLRAWKDQGPTEYKAEAKLTADKPIPIKLLYYNAWFAGSIKLSWSSASQKRELIPRSRLLPPDPDPVIKVEERPSLADNVKVETIGLPATIKNDPGGKKPSIILAWLKDEGLLGWNDEKGSLHLTRLGADLKPRGEDVLLDKLDLRGLVPHDDGSVALLAADLPNRMCVLKVDRRGKELFRTVLVGDKGRGEGGHYLDDHFSFTGRFVASPSGVYAAHFAHSANFGKGGVHQGGFYAVIDGAGKVQHSSNWTVSHSMDQRLIAMRDGGFLTISAGDCYPKGLVFENRDLSISRVLFPEPDKQEKFGNCGGFVNATLGSLVAMGARDSLTFLTKEGETTLLMYLLFEEDGQELKRSKLAEMPATADCVVRHATLGDHLLLAWQQKAGETTLARLHPSGVLMSKPTTVKERLPQNDDLVMFPGGDIGWISAKTGERQLRVIRVRP